MRGNRTYTISSHAIERFQERVANVEQEVARRAIAALAREGRSKTRPRHWMRGFAAATPGTQFFYHHKLPGVCLVVRGRVVVTVYSRAVCKRWSSMEDHRGQVRRPDSNTNFRAKTRKSEEFAASSVTAQIDSLG